jgi:ornithine cyclodeaminase
VSTALPYLHAAELADLLTPGDAVDLLERRLADGSINPENDSPRLFSPAPAGEFLVMPASANGFSGVKVVTVAPENPQSGWPKIQGVYVLFESGHLNPVAVLDAAALTLLRTPAVTALAVRHLLAADPRGSKRIDRLVIVGTGPQAEQHFRSLAVTIAPAEMVVLGRRPAAADALAGRCRDLGITVRCGTPADLPEADVIVCVTSSSRPVLDDAQVGANSIVCAVGAHGADRREVSAELVLRSDVVVEGRGSALREGGNLLAARTAHQWAQTELTNLADLVAGRFHRRAGHPAFFSGVGMAWQDIAIAGHLYTQHRNRLASATSR